MSISTEELIQSITEFRTATQTGDLATVEAILAKNLAQHWRKGKFGQYQLGNFAPCKSGEYFFSDYADLLEHGLSNAIHCKYLPIVKCLAPLCNMSNLPSLNADNQAIVSYLLTLPAIQNSLNENTFRDLVSNAIQFGHLTIVVQLFTLDKVTDYLNALEKTRNDIAVMYDYELLPVDPIPVDPEHETNTHCLAQKLNFTPTGLVNGLSEESRMSHFQGLLRSFPKPSISTFLQSYENIEAAVLFCPINEELVTVQLPAAIVKMIMEYYDSRFEQQVSPDLLTFVGTLPPPVLLSVSKQAIKVDPPEPLKPTVGKTSSLK